MNQNDEIRTKNFFRNKFKEHGDSPQASDWGKEQSQLVRSQVFTNYFNCEGKKILDIGCGLGYFYKHLKNNNINCSFTGYDLVQEVVNMASEKYPQAKFESKNILTDEINENFDLIFLSGAFNYKIDNHLDWVKLMIKRMFELANEGVAFNILSINADFMDDVYYYGNPKELIDYCLSLTRNVCLRHDYYPHDFTIFMSKNEWSKK
ncbi:MAG: class I SAM-dependent methyltransferase [Candidatus Omnitrophica bacterium]|nr:class I SAM-dependent methyltransferase [Candidatus Omnitrophota bacterium]MBU1997388.1 class I SAM-dependent methyltransferase [Candidatus Omnitrophota bacterium]